MFYAYVIFFHIAAIASVKSNKSEGIFYQINDQLLAVLDSVLISLEIDKNFTKSKNVKDYMSLHKLVKNAIKKNDHKYERILEISETQICNKTAYFILNINRVIKEMIREQKVGNRSVVSDKSNNTRQEDTLDFVNLVSALDIKTNSNNLKAWDSELSRADWNTRRLFGGKRTTIKKYPFVVSIHVVDRFTCTGSVLREDLVLTAASCLLQFFSQKLDSARVKVRVGSEYTDKSGRVVPVAALLFHPLFNQTTLSHNLVILRLETLLKFQRRKVMGIQFDRKAKDMPENLDGVIILGWGQAPQNDGRLTKAFLHLYDLEHCMNIYSRSYVTNENFCAGYSKNAAVACQNDIGGPAIVGSTLMGVVSFGSPYCGRSHSPTVFTKLGYYGSWIKKVFDKIPRHNNVSKNYLSDICEDESEDEFSCSEEPNTNDLYILKRIATDVQENRQKAVQRDFYDILDEKDTFDSTTMQPIDQHPLIDKGIFLDPNLVPIPEFSDSEETSRLPLITAPVPEQFQPPNKEHHADYAWDMYKTLVSQLLQPTTTTPAPTEAPATTTERVTWPSGMLNVSHDAYVDFAFETTTLFLPTVTGPRPLTRMGPTALSDDSESESDQSIDTDVKFELEPSKTQREDESLSKSDVNDQAEVIFLNAGSTKRFVFDRKKIDMNYEVARLKN